MNLYLSQDAQKQFNRLPKAQQKKIKKKLEYLLIALHAGKKLSGELSGLRSLKAWPYRIFYQNKETGIFIVTILHRQGAYK